MLELLSGKEHEIITGVTIVDGACWLDQFTPGRVLDPHLNTFVRQRVTVHAERGRPDYTASVAITLDDGTTRREDVRVPKGDPQDPLTREEVVSKFRTAAAPALSKSSIDRVIDHVTNLQEVRSMREVTAELGVPRREASTSTPVAGLGANAARRQP